MMEDIVPAEPSKEINNVEELNGKKLPTIQEGKRNI
jgi:hypothetical protein